MTDNVAQAEPVAKNYKSRDRDAALNLNSKICLSKTKNRLESISDYKCFLPMKHSGDTVYSLGLIGALVYNLQRATDLSTGFIAVLKSLVWPAFLVYKACLFLKP